MPITISRRRVALPSALLAAVSAFASGGCLTGPLAEGNAAQPHLELKVYPVSCDDGRRYAAKTLKSRGYTITRVTRDGTSTRVDGENKVDKVKSGVSVNCGADGVMMTPHASSIWVVDGLRFGFHQIAEIGDKVWPPPSGPVVSMEFYAGEEAKIEFPTEIEPLGVVAVRVRVLNAGERTLRVDPRRVKAITESGAVSQPLAEGEKRLAGSDPEIRSKVLRAIKLKQGESSVGFVFFPVGSYTSGSIALIDDQTGEADDFDVNFGTS